MRQTIIIVLLIVMAIAFVYLRFSQMGQEFEVIDIVPEPKIVEVVEPAQEVIAEENIILSKIPKLQINDIEIEVELADTPEKQRQGLSGHDPLLDKQGMLFLMEREARHSFWMKDMKFDLDIIWILNNKIVDISDNVSAPVGDEMPVTVQAQEPADHVLEVNADFTEKYNVRVGDEVIMKY